MEPRILTEDHYESAMWKIIEDRFDLTNEAIRSEVGPNRNLTSKLHLSQQPFGLLELMHVETSEMITTIEIYPQGDGQKAFSTGKTEGLLATYDSRFQLRIRAGEPESIDKTLIKQMGDFAKYVELRALDLRKSELNVELDKINILNREILPETFGW